MSDRDLESQTVAAFIEWRADRNVSLEMRCKDGSDTWGPCVIKDDCWWHHSYYRLKLSASAPIDPPYLPARTESAVKPGRPALVLKGNK